MQPADTISLQCVAAHTNTLILIERLAIVSARCLACCRYNQLAEQGTFGIFKLFQCESSRGGHFLYWARHFGISLLPKVKFCTEYRILHIFNKWVGTCSFSVFLSVLKSLSKNSEGLCKHFEGICKNFNHLKAFQSILKALNSKRAGCLRFF